MHGKSIKSKKKSVEPVNTGVASLIPLKSLENTKIHYQYEKLARMQHADDQISNGSATSQSKAQKILRKSLKSTRRLIAAPNAYTAIDEI